MLARRSEARIALDTPFRGARGYVHSTDLFAALDELSGSLLGPGAYLKSLTLRRRAYHSVVARFRPDPDAFGTFTFAASQWVVEGWLVEDSTPISRRIAFDEAPIAQQAICGQGRVLLQSPVAGYDPFEQLIVLFKMLCAQSHPGSWLFTSIALNQPLSRQAALSVTRTQMVLGRMVEAVLSQNDVPAGRIQMVRSATGGAT
ncbi:MAG TPA: hypothetical protein VGH23_04195 [Rhizomicrobium sp.]|jgi:hypothetical protein